MKGIKLRMRMTNKINKQMSLKIYKNQMLLLNFPMKMTNKRIRRSNRKM